MYFIKYKIFHFLYFMKHKKAVIFENHQKAQEPLRVEITFFCLLLNLCFVNCHYKNI